MNNTEDMGFGIIGCGMIAHFHAQAIAQMSDASLVGIYGRNQSKANAFADKHQCTAFTTCDALLNDPRIAVVTIATPSGAHLEPSVQAAAAGKHVICEKPLEVTLERIDRMIAACKQNGVSLSGIFPRRFYEATAVLKRAIDAGRFGNIIMADAYIKWYRTQEYYDSGEWRGTWTLDGGGALMNQSIHTIDLLLHLVGDVESVCAFADRTGHDRIEVEDIAVAVLRFRNGATGVIEGSTSCYSRTGHPAEIQICGCDGSVFMKDDKFSVWDFRDEHADDRQIRSRFGEQPGAIGVGAADPSAIDFTGHQRNFEDSVRAIRSGTDPMVDGTEGRRAIESILAIYQSAMNDGKKVDLPLPNSPALSNFLT